MDYTQTIMVEVFGSALVTGLLLVFPLWRIFRRAGLQPIFSLLVFIPGIGFIAVLLMLALSRWPALESGETGI
ncbi:hypothetical protein [Telmatospirillum sp. J64-1]|uniref:hypothetical protein n=1 Tax=Telmatospirillum sp. J64-1 TaxID=2502183 RepID=UPI002107BC95|nr:hypothetical protein [Telmatospirillum sp. J64-1]